MTIFVGLGLSGSFFAMFALCVLSVFLGKKVIGNLFVLFITNVVHQKNELRFSIVMYLSSVYPK